jgi:hypothetical protein
MIATILLFDAISNWVKRKTYRIVYNNDKFHRQYYTVERKNWFWWETMCSSNTIIKPFVATYSLPYEFNTVENAANAIVEWQKPKEPPIRLKHIKTVVRVLSVGGDI